MKELNQVSGVEGVHKSLPHNFLAEKIVLSCLLFHDRSVAIVIHDLPVEAFYFRNHQEIYRAIIFMYKNNMPIDSLTLLTFLQDNGLLEKAGGVEVITELISQVPNFLYLKTYISLMRDKFMRRSLIKLSYEMINSSHITNIPVESILKTLETRIFSLNNATGYSQFFSSAQVVNTVFFELKNKSINPSLNGLSSGFYELDALIQGFQKSDLIIIAGRPSMGKTAFGLNVAVNVIKNDQLPVLFFSLEMSKEQIMYRLLSMESSINQMRLKSGKLYDDDWVKLNKVINVIAKLPFFMDDTTNVSVEDIRSKMRALLFEQKRIGLVVIDYLQLMQDSRTKNETRVQELSKITRSLKILAKEFQVPIIALSQLSRNLENRPNKKPILSDLRESGSIEQDADLILMLSRTGSETESSNDSESRTIDLIVAKQRNGPTGTVTVGFEGKQTKFFNLFPEDE